MDKEHMDAFLSKLKTEVKKRYDRYLTRNAKERIDNISLHAGPNIDNYMSGLGVLGYSLKMEENVVHWADYCKGCKQFDIVISPTLILQQVGELNEKLKHEGNVINGDDAILSIITHEFMHSISVCNEDPTKDRDEALTDYFAKIFFDILASKYGTGRRYYTTYSYVEQPDIYKVEKHYRPQEIYEDYLKEIYFVK